MTLWPRRSSWATSRRVCRSGSRLSEVVAAEVVVQLARAEHVPAGAEDRVLDGAERAAVADPGAQPLVLGLQVAVVGSDRGHGGVLERVIEPLRSLPGPPDRRLPADWLLPGHWPAQEASCPAVGKHRHVDADLGEDVLGGAGLDPVNAAQQLTPPARKGEAAPRSPRTAARPAHRGSPGEPGSRRPAARAAARTDPRAPA